MRRMWPGALRARVLLVLGVVAVVAGTAVVIWRVTGADRAPSAGASAVATAPLSEQEATELAARLSDPDPEVAVTALASTVRPSFEAEPGPMLPSDGTLTIDADSFEAGAADGYGSVEATVGGPQAASFVLLLVDEGDGWHVLGSVPQ